MPPSLGVIVPAHNGAGYLEKSLVALKKASDEYRLKGGESEIVVMDDAGFDGVSFVAKRLGVRSVRLPAPPSGPSAARNRGARETKAEILVFIDADVMAQPDTLVKIGEFFSRNPDYHALFGSYDESPADPGIVSQYKNLFHHYVHQTSQENSSSFWAGCGAIRADVFRDVGGFPESYERPAIEDIELGYTLMSKGYRSFLMKDLQVKHLKKWTLFQLIKTDIFMRGAPWTKLLLKTRSFASDLNLQTHNRVSVVLVYLMILFALGAYKWAWFAAAAVALCAVFIFLNFRLYSFFGRRKGFAFVLLVIPLHLLYYFYNGVSFILGVAGHLYERIRGASE